ncbi:MAG: hypothetical protein AAGG57_04620 [Pseudomonadota bacterium]
MSEQHAGTCDIGVGRPRNGCFEPRGYSIEAEDDFDDVLAMFPQRGWDLYLVASQYKP